MTRPKPDVEYITLQKRLYSLLEKADPGTAEQRRRLQTDLQKRFMEAWGFYKDYRNRTLKLKRLLPGDGFDHTNYYCDPSSSAMVIVTQPYYDPSKQLEAALTIGLWIKPDVISAPEWGFYYPKRAHLVIVKFPHGYDSVVKAIKRAMP